MLRRRTLLKAAFGAAALGGVSPPIVRSADQAVDSRGVSLAAPAPGEDIFAYLQRTTGGFDAARYKQILGSANPFKEGDLIVGVAAADETSRATARTLLSATRVRDIEAHPPLQDRLFRLLTQSVDQTAAAKTSQLTLGELKQLLLRESEAAIRSLLPGLSSDVIACVVKLMSDEELVAVGKKIFNPLPGSRIGAKGYLGARIQPN